MNHVVYYMPRIFKHEINVDTTNFLKLVGKNASAVDRTNTFSLPFSTYVLDPIPLPQKFNDVQSAFNDALLARAKSILDQNKEVVIYYSGGLDSTTTLVAFDKVIKDNSNYSKDQVTIATSLDAMYENKQAWWDLVLGYRVVNVHTAMSNMSVHDQKRHVFSENADQLFGSDKMFHYPNITSMLLNAPLTEENIKIYTDALEIVDNYPAFAERLHTLIKSAPFEITHMRELLWWINFTCKWQSVSLRALCFTDVFNSHPISKSDLGNLATFYNDRSIQSVVMNKEFSRFSETPSATTYKNAFRKFLFEMHPSWKDYIHTKVKIGSLYNVIKHRTFTFDQIEYDTQTQTFTVSNT